MLVVFLIILFPMCWNLVLSFQPIRLQDLAQISLLDFSRFSLDNYKEALDERFWSGLRITLIYSVLGTSLSIMMGLWASVIARSTFPGRNIFRSLLLFPYVAPLVSSAFIWRFMLDKHMGVVNVAVKSMGGQPMAWLTTRAIQICVFGIDFQFPIALTSLIIFEGWRYFPFAFLFILARMQAIPDELYEVAKVDGASPLQRFHFITLPQIKNTLSILFFLRFIWTFYKFDDIFLLNGGVAGADVLSIQIYRWFFARKNVGVAAAIGVLLAMLLIVLAMAFQRWTVSREDS